MSRTIDGAAPEVQAEFDSLWRSLDGNIAELTRRLERLENEIERAQVPPGPPEHRDLAALDRHFDGRCDALSKRVDALEHQDRVLFHNAGVETGIREDIGRRVAALENERARNITALVEDGLALKLRLDALEQRLPRPIPVVTPLAPRCPCEDGSLCALVPGSKAHPHPVCVRCRGPVEPERHCYVHPTCYRCLPPPEPLRVVTPRMWGNTRAPGRVWVGDEPPTEEQVQAALAPSPDYRSDLPAEVEACSCEEAVELRRQLEQVRLDFANSCDVGRRLEARVEELRHEIGAANAELKQVADARDAANATLGRIGVYADTYGTELVPTGPDSYGEGVRAAKRTIKNMLSAVQS